MGKMLRKYVWKKLYLLKIVLVTYGLLMLFYLCANSDWPKIVRGIGKSVKVCAHVEVEEVDVSNLVTGW